MDTIGRNLIRRNDEWTEASLREQIRDASSRYYGGIRDESGIARPTHVGTPRYMAVWACALVHPQSRYYHDSGLLEAFGLAADFLLNRQHPDGTVSLGSTNFNSPPDTAFVVGGLAQVYRLLEEHPWTPLAEAREKLRLFLERTIPAMDTGGCHTPNHRWVLTAALAMLHELFGRPELAARAEAWLAEGMDITADGEWTERSNGIYNAVSNIALYHTARLLGRPELLEYVRRNLKMMAYLFHPGGEVVTDYSGRQDFGQAADPAPYALVCRLMAAHDRDGLLASMADYASGFVRQPEAVNNNLLLGWLLDPSLSLEGVERTPLPDRYEVVLNGTHPVREHTALAEAAGHGMRILHSSMHLAFGSPVVRIRDGDLSATVMAGTPSFLSLRHGRAKLLGVKLAASFEPGIVKFDEFESAGGGIYRLARTAEKGYNGPVPQAMLPARPGGGDLSPWYLLPHQHRPMTHLQEHRLEAEVSRLAGEWKIRVQSDGREDVLAQLTFVFAADGELAGEGLQPAGEGRHFLTGGRAVYRVAEAALELEGGAFEHRLPVLREDVHPADCRCVHINLVTPFDHTVTIRLL
ncbi:hypothetical protein PM3016_4927 [Paenibacillus mucilaginosus 3016]|uniref:Heparinase II/III family protein n=1 Tax=Paenibacillus mucilaginosus 3016 TaxID=1116391 RepID=H6NLU4_9BACL|nr:hypothetical protein [Paenibacillus mucilaginosus]AFC31659.1 hypothetical protein PM3016_4927 [Paenibacillus mucilaginosus 3016]WFA20192.1 hypothetical protein ERY13_24610 [Paenibacillus mucilaginosus]